MQRHIDRAYLHLFHLNTNALNLTEHGEQIIEAVQDLALLLQQLHQVAPLVQNLLLSAHHVTIY